MLPLEATATAPNEVLPDVMFEVTEVILETPAGPAEFAEVTLTTPDEPDQARQSNRQLPED